MSKIEFVIPAQIPKWNKYMKCKLQTTTAVLHMYVLYFIPTKQKQ